MEMRAGRNEEVIGSSPPQHLDASGKYTTTRYTMEQIEILEKVFSECSKPDYSHRLQMIRQFPVLANVQPKQIKIWFQNRRKREKQRNATSELQSANRKQAAKSELYVEEINRLQKQVTMLVSNNGSFHRANKSCGEEVPILHQSVRDSNNAARLLSIAEDTLSRFLSKAKGTAINWVNIPGMKPDDPDSVRMFFISKGCRGVAARACDIVNLDATKIATILKDRTSWSQDCRRLEVFATIATDNGGIIEVVYTQTYSPTILAQARDFWTLRYTTTLYNGSVVVCERSISGNENFPDAITALQFVRGEMLSSGYLIRPCESGGFIIYIVDHLNLEAWNAPGVLRPLYDSSEVVAQRITIPALEYVKQIAQEETDDVPDEAWRQPTILRTYTQKLIRGFNDAINGFTDDGWSQLGSDVTENVIITVKSPKTGASSSSHQADGGILCAKSSMILQNVSPAVLVRVLRERRSEWADFGVDSHCAASLKASYYPHSLRPTKFTGNQTVLPLGHAIGQDQMLEVIRLESLHLDQEDASILEDVHLLQMYSEMDESCVGAYSELVFAPIDGIFSDDASILPSGFRIIPLHVKPGDTQDLWRNKAQGQGPSSSNSLGPYTISNDAGNASSSYTEQAILTMAFQFPIANNMQENVASMAHQYVRGVISSVRRLSFIYKRITPSASSPDFMSNLLPANPEAHNLAQWIRQSYCSQVGGELLRGDWSDGGSILRNLWNHRDAILCFSLEPRPQLIFANQAGLNMLGTTFVALKDIAVEKIISYPALSTFKSEFPRIMHLGFTCLPGGICMSTMGRHSLYDQAVAWKVLAGDGVTPHCVAVSFVNWCFS